MSHMREAQVLLQQRIDGAPRPGRAQVDGVLPHHDLGGADHLRGQGRDHVLHQLHDGVVVHVGPVQLHHGELGVVDQRDALVPEVLPDLEDAVESAHQQPLEVELGSDAQVEVGVERVVVGDERPRERAAGQRLQDGRLDFHEPLALQVAAHGRHQLAASRAAARRRPGWRPGPRSAGDSGSPGPAGRATSPAAGAATWSAASRIRRRESARRAGCGRRGLQPR